MWCGVVCVNDCYLCFLQAGVRPSYIRLIEHPTGTIFFLSVRIDRNVLVFSNRCLENKGRLVIVGQSPDRYSKIDSNS